MAVQQGVRFLEPDLLRKLDPLSLANRRRLRADGKGERRSTRRGASIEFMDYRQYSPGDDLRQVDWNAYGRLGSLHVKLFEEEEVLAVHLLIDVSRSMDWGAPNKLELARKLAGALGYVTLGGYDRVEAATIGADRSARVGPLQGTGGIAPLFRFLERVEAAPRAADGLSAALRSYALQRRVGGMAIVISDLLSPDGCEDGIRALLQRRFEVAILHVLAPEEISPILGGDVRLVDRESGANVDITLNQRALDLYHRRFDAWAGGIEILCRKHGVLYQRISTATSLEDVLFRDLRARGLLA